MREIETGRKPITERLSHPYAAPQGTDTDFVLPPLPPVHSPQPFATDDSMPVGLIAGLIGSLNRNAAFLSGVMDTSRVVSSPHVEAGALRIFTNNPDLSLTALTMLNELVADITIARAAILLAQKE